MSCQHLQDGNLKTHPRPRDEQVLTSAERVAGSTRLVGSVRASNRVVHRFWPNQGIARTIKGAGAGAVQTSSRYDLFIRLFVAPGHTQATSATLSERQVDRDRSLFSCLPPFEPAILLYQS